MDIKMPDLDGYGALKVIKRIRPELPVIAHSAYASMSDRKKVLSAGFDDYLSKPIEKAKLLDVLKKFIEK